VYNSDPLSLLRMHDVLTESGVVPFWGLFPSLREQLGEPTNSWFFLLSSLEVAPPDAFPAESALPGLFASLVGCGPVVGLYLNKRFKAPLLE